MPLNRIIAEHFESPGTKAYTFDEVKKLFRAFSVLDVQPTLTYYDYAKAKGIFPPTWLVRLLGEQHGWFITVKGTKST